MTVVAGVADDFAAEALMLRTKGVLAEMDYAAVDVVVAVGLVSEDCSPQNLH